MNQKQKQYTRNETERFALFILIFTVIEVGLLVFLLTSHLLPKNWKWGSPDPEVPTEEQTTQGEDTTQPPEQSVPVFSGGTLPMRPIQSTLTESLGAEILSEYAILVDYESGEILAFKNADVRFSPASMTKVMTLIVACENLTAEDLERRVVYTQEIADYVRSGNYDGTSTSLPLESGGLSCIGDEYTVKDLLYGIGVASAADCTYMIVKEVAGSEEAFVEMMNQKAAWMGLTDTHFDNAVGFDSENNYTTAGEMAMMMSYAMQNSLITDLLAVRKDNYDIRSYYLNNGIEDSYKVTLKNSLNSRLEKYPQFHLSTSKLVATKTGYTTESFMVLMAQGMDGRQYILVLGEKDSGESTIPQKFKNTMLDIEKILNTYVK